LAVLFPTDDTSPDAALALKAERDAVSRFVVWIDSMSGEALEIALVGYSAHVFDWGEHGRRVGESILRRGKLPAQPQPKHRHRLPVSGSNVRKRRPTVISVVRQAAKAGLPVARVEVDPDNGKISLVVGKPAGVVDTNDTTSPVDRSEWN
jgi:hypothetical protein